MVDVHDIGLDGKDRVKNAFGGGFPKSSVVVVRGSEGTGKSILSQRILYGLCEEEKSVAYVTPEFGSGSFVGQMESLNYPIMNHMLVTRNLLFISTDLKNTKDGLLDRLVGRNSSDIWSRDFVIFDGLEMLIRSDRFRETGESDDVEVREFIRYIDRVKNSGLTVFITFNPSRVRDSVSQMFSDRADVLLDIETNSKGGSVDHMIMVRKYNRMNDEVDQIISFEVQSGNGMVIKTRSVT